jgi:mitochondrial fission protein ELM1
MSRGLRRNWRALVLGDGCGPHGQQTGAERQALALAAAVLARAHTRGTSASGWRVSTRSLAAVQHPMPRLFRPLPEDPVRRQLAQQAGRLFLAPLVGHLVPTRFAATAPAPAPFNAPNVAGGDWSSTLIVIAGTAPSAAGILTRDAMPGAKLVQVLLPTRRVSALGRFDVVVTPAHDFAPGEVIPGNVLQTTGALHDISASRLDSHAKRSPSVDVLALPRPRISVLLGGPRGRRFLPSQFSGIWTDAEAAILAGRVAALAGSSGSVVLTVSRRTPPSFALRLQRQLFKNLGGSERVLYDDGSLRSRYLFILASSDALVVTGDSANMLSEATASDALVFIAGLSGSKRLDRYIDALIENGSRCATILEHHCDRAVDPSILDGRKRQRAKQAAQRKSEGALAHSEEPTQVDQIAEEVCDRLNI